MRKINLAIFALVMTITATAQTPVAVTCCNCLGDSATFNLSTGQGSPVDSNWTVNGNPAYATSPSTAWTIPGAWIQSVNASTPQATAAGVYRYSIQFTTPDCIIPMTARLDGTLGADNSATVYLDGTTLLASCSSGQCFQGAALPFSQSSLSVGGHTLDVVVTNNASSIGGPTVSGLTVTARVSTQCAGCNRCPVIGRWDGANCFIGAAPTGTTAFQYKNNFYYTPSAGNQCPLAGSWFDGANCFVTPIPVNTTPFIWNNGWYVQPAPCNSPQPVKTR